MSKDKSLVQLGKKIRAIREVRGRSQEQLAMDAELDRAYYGRIERGEANVAALNLLKIAKALDADVGEVFPSKPR